MRKISVLFLALLLNLSAWAQTPSPSPSASGTPTATASATPQSPTASANATATASNSAALASSGGSTAIALGSIPSQLQDFTLRLQTLQAGLTNDDLYLTVQNGIPGLIQQIDMGLKDDALILQNRADLESLGSLNSKWADLEKTLPAWRTGLATRANQLDDQISQLSQSTSTWQVTLQEAQAAGLSQDVMQSMQGALNTAKILQGRLKDRRAQVVAAQAAVETQAGRVKGARERLVEARAQTVNQVFVRDALPLWDSQITSRMGPSLVFDIYNSLANEVQGLVNYLNSRWLTLLGIAAFFTLLYVALQKARLWATTHVAEHADLERALVVLHRPAATAMLLTVVLHRWMDHSAPRLLLAGLGAVVLIPAALLLRGLLEKRMWPLLTALVAAYFIDQLRLIAAPVPLLARIILALETGAGAVFLGAFLFSKRFKPAAEVPQTRGHFKPLYLGLQLVFWLLLLTVVADISGFYALAGLVGQGLLGSIYFAVMLYGALKTLDALLVLALRIPPMSRLHYLRNHGTAVRRNTMRVLAFLAVLVWVLSILEFLSLRSPVVETLQSVFSAPFGVGSLQLTLGGMVASVIVIWGAVQLSRFFRAALEEDVYPHVRLARGVPYAVSTSVHYLVLTIGIVTGLAALGVDTNKLTIVAGALSVGIGFGLQNIINNFISGLILLFDRPVNVGDQLKLGDLSGKLLHIGLRTSTMNLGDGSLAIVPNSDIINQRVINWSADGPSQRLDLRFSLVLEGDPRSVLQMLTKTASETPGIQATPAPKALVVAFNGRQIDLQLLCWSAELSKTNDVKSDLHLRLLDAFREAHVEQYIPVT